MRLTMGLWSKMLLFLLFAIQSLYAQDKPALEYQVKAAFLYNFTRFINWPPTAFTAPDAPFVIGIVGNDPFGTYIEEIVAGEKVGDRKIIVQHYQDVKEIGNCQIIFIHLSESSKVKEILTALESHNILAVSDIDNFAKLGGQVRFFKESNKVKIQINMEAAKRSQLEISSKLLRIAKILK